MKQNKNISLAPFAVLIFVFFCAVNAAEEQQAQSKTDELSVTESTTSRCCSDSESDPLQELEERSVSVQAHSNDLEQTMIDDLQSASKKEHEKYAHTVIQKLGMFLKENSFALIATACTLVGLYFNYHFNEEALKFTRASFVIGNGESAIKNISMVADGQYAQYKAMVVKEKAQAAA